MSCQYDKYINDMLYGKLSEDREEELFKHAEGCAECSMKLKEIEDIDSVIKEAVTYSDYKDFRYKTLQAVEESKGFTGFKVFLYKSRAYIYALAAILLVVVTMYSYRYLMNPQSPAGVDTNPQDNITPAPSQDGNENDTGKQANINDLVTIKEEVNKEGTTPNGDKAQYIYKIPVINIDKPGAKKINEMFLNLEKDMERRIGDGQNMTLTIDSKAFLYDGIISVVMVINKPGPGGIYAVNYDMENDKEVSTKELIEKYKFDPQTLIAEINRQEQIDNSKPEEEQYYIGPIIDLFADTVIRNMYTTDEYLNKREEILNKTQEQKESFVIENIEKIVAYINNDGKFVFIHSGPLPDEELVVTGTAEQTGSITVTPEPGSVPNNIKDVKGFVPFEDQSFMVNLDSWGNVKFVSGKLTGGNHIPTVFYLTDENGNIRYSFQDSPFPYSVDVKSVSFTDVNKDGLKDIIIIVGDVYAGANGDPIAAVWLQNTDGTFTNDSKLYQEINESGNNKDIETVKDYLSKKF